MSTPRGVALVIAALISGSVLSGCSTSSGSGSTAGAPAPTGTPATALTLPALVPTTTAPATATPTPTPSATSAPTTAPPAVAFSAGNPNGHASIPSAAQAVDTAHPTRKIGTGTPAGCTSAAVVAAVAAGGIITFNCGPNPIVITMQATAKVVNAHPQIVLDGGGKVTLSGAGSRRILYMNTCDQAQGWTSSHCQDQSTPELTVQNLTFEYGNSTGQTAFGGGGGAIFASGGRLKVVNSKFVSNRCDSTGPDLGGAAIRAFEQYDNLPVYIVDSTFGGAPGQGGICSNGGALSSIGVSWVVINSVMTYNSAIGNGANPARSGTPGGGSGGAIYTDGNAYTVTVEDSIIEHNVANEGGGALFFVSNDKTGTLAIQGSTLSDNVSKGFSTAGYPGIFFLGSGSPSVKGSSLH
ncbi:MAG TPA: hypothetical protein VGX23_05750 [Actinocrinis sp.]|nr:hypothetical protein [Actinocrinis sp.]